MSNCASLLGFSRRIRQRASNGSIVDHTSEVANPHVELFERRTLGGVVIVICWTIHTVLESLWEIAAVPYSSTIGFTRRVLQSLLSLRSKCPRSSRRLRGKTFLTNTAHSVECLEDRTVLTVTIPGTFDFFIAEPGETTIDIGTETEDDNPPLPSGFFGSIGDTQSDPFMQAEIALEGNPTAEQFQRFAPPMRLGWPNQFNNNTGPNVSQKLAQQLVPVEMAHYDTVVRRLNDVDFESVGETETVEIEVVALSLKSVEPIVISYGDAGIRRWDVFVTLDEGVTQPIGSLDLKSDAFEDGVSVSGTIANLDLPVAYKVTFRDVDAPSSERVIPSGDIPSAVFGNDSGTFQFPVGELVAEMSDTLLVDVDGDGVAGPGDTIRYEVGIENFSGGDLTGVQFMAELAGTTIDLTSINFAPVANPDTYDIFGNMNLDTNAVGLPSVLGNDQEFLSHSIGGNTFVTAFDDISMAGGIVDMDANGAFTYVPPAGFGGTDLFTYTITDPFGAEDTGLVRLRVQRTWFIDADNGSDDPVNGDGTFDRPFQTPELTNALGLVGDFIYVQDDGPGNTNGGFVLKDDQHLLGSGQSLERDGFTFIAAGAPPTIGSPNSTGITLASGNTVGGLDVDSPSGGGIVGQDVGVLTIGHTGGLFHRVNVSANGGSAIDIRNGTVVDLSFGEISADNILDPTVPGVRLNDIGGDVFIGGATGIDSAGPGFETFSVLPLNIRAIGQVFVVDAGGAVASDGISIHLDPSNLGGSSTVNFDGGIGIYKDNGGTGLVIASTPMVTIKKAAEDNTIEVENGAAVRIENSSIDVEGIDSIFTDEGNTGILFDNVDGTFKVDGLTQIGNTFGPGILVSNNPDSSWAPELVFGSLEISFGVNEGIVLSNTRGSFHVTGMTTLNVVEGGIRVSDSSVNVDFDDVVTINNGNLFGRPGVHLEGNDGSFFDFNGLDITNSGPGIGLIALNGGEIEITDPNNTIVSQAEGVRIDGVLLGPNGVTFDVVQSGGIEHPGISLRNVGTAGGLTVGGTPGTDRYQGGEGDDILAGGPGSDALVGGPGNDTALFEFGESAYTVTPEVDGMRQVILIGAVPPEIDVLSSIENLVFGVSNGPLPLPTAALGSLIVSTDSGPSLDVLNRSATTEYTAIENIRSSDSPIAAAIDVSDGNGAAIPRDVATSSESAAAGPMPGIDTIDIGTLLSEQTLILTFDVVVDSVPVSATEISNQGVVVADGGVRVLTDDPATAVPADPTLTPVSATSSLDADGNGVALPLSDGILVLRFLAGFTGDALIDGVVDTVGGTRTSAAEITSILTQLRTVLDVDGNGVVNPLNDGILVIRFLASFTGDSLTDGAVDTVNGVRTTAAEIEAYLGQFMPPAVQSSAVPVFAFGAATRGDAAASISLGSPPALQPSAALRSVDAIPVHTAKSESASVRQAVYESSDSHVARRAVYVPLDEVFVGMIDPEDDLSWLFS